MKLPPEFVTPIGIELHVLNTGDWRYQRPVTDPRKCIQCTACWLFCPTGSRHQTPEGHFDVDLRFCKGCGICANECYANAIVMVEEVRE